MVSATSPPPHRYLSSSFGGIHGYAWLVAGRALLRLGRLAAEDAGPRVNKGGGYDVYMRGELVRRDPRDSRFQSRDDVVDGHFRKLAPESRIITP